MIDNRGTGVLVWEPQSYQPMFTSVPGMRGYYQPYASIDVFNKSFAKNILENNVYVTTVEKSAPTLPDTVSMLTTSDGSVTPVPVTWDAVDPALYEVPNNFTVTGATEYGNVTANISVIYAFSGFFPPVNNLPVINQANAGSAVPLKFRLNGDHGLSILAGIPTSQQVICDTGAPIGEAVQAVSNEFSYDATSDQYKFTWKTVKSWSGTCRQFILMLSDGTEYRTTYLFH